MMKKITGLMLGILFFSLIILASASAQSFLSGNFTNYRINYLNTTNISSNVQNIIVFLNNTYGFGDANNLEKTLVLVNELPSSATNGSIVLYYNNYTSYYPVNSSDNGLLQFIVEEGNNTDGTPNAIFSAGINYYFPFNNSVSNLTGGSATSNKITFNSSVSEFGYSANFNQTDEYFDLGNVMNPNENRTIEFWIYLDASVPAGRQLFQYPCDDGRIAQNSIDLTPANVMNLNFDSPAGACGGGGGISTSALPLQEWVLVDIVYYGSSVRLYINGTLDASSDDVATGTSTSNWVFGNNKQYDNGLDTGLLDEFVIYNKSLSADEVRAKWELSKASNNYLGAEGNVTGNPFDITDCRSITASGVYTLKNDIFNSSSDKCINITASDVEIECDYYTIEGQNTAGTIGIDATSLSNITIKNCNLSYWKYYIYFSGTTNSIIRNNTFNSLNNPDMCSIVAGSNNNLAENNLFNEGEGFYFNTVSGNELRNNNYSNTAHQSIYLDTNSNNNYIHDEVMTSNSVVSYCLYVEQAYSNVFENIICNQFLGARGIYLTKFITGSYDNTFRYITLNGSNVAVEVNDAGANNVIEDSRIRSATGGSNFTFTGTNGLIIFLNSTYTGELTGGGTGDLDKEWKLRIEARNSTGQAIGGQLINITNKTGGLVTQLITDNSGIAIYNITEYHLTTSTYTYMNNYTISIANSTWGNYSNQFNLTSSENLQVTLGFPPIPPAPPIPSGFIECPAGDFIICPVIKTVGAGLGLILQYMSISLPLLLIVIVIAGVIVFIASGIGSLLKNIAKR